MTALWLALGEKRSTSHDIMLTRDESFWFVFQVDIFSFSMVIYEILTGRRPFAEYENLSQVTKALMMEEKRPMLKVWFIVFPQSIEKIWCFFLPDDFLSGHLSQIMPGLWLINLWMDFEMSTTFSLQSM